MSGLTLTSPHCASHTVIQGHVLGTQVVHLQIEFVFSIVSGDSESIFHRVDIVYASNNTINV